MRIAFKVISAIILSCAVFNGCAYLMVLVSSELAYLGVAAVPLLMGLMYKTDLRYGIPIYTLTIALPIITGYILLAVFSGSNAAYLFAPTALIAAGLGSFLRNGSAEIPKRYSNTLIAAFTTITIGLMFTAAPQTTIFGGSKEVREPVPSANLKTLDGNSVSFAEMESEIVVLDFWATWCGPCLQLMPQVKSLNEKYQDNPRVRIWAVNTSWREKPEKVRSFLEDRPLGVPVLYDKNAELTDSLGIKAIPYTVIIDNRTNKVRLRKQGFAPSSDYVGIMSNHIEEMLDNS